jgi:4'-phosphopantetheinyl transferase
MEVAAEPGLQFTIRPFSSGVLSNLCLDLHQIHVWYIPLDLPNPAVARLRESLSPAECERADRFHFDKHRAQFVSTRGTLRLLLSSYLDIPAERIGFQYSDHGKPNLADSSRRKSLEFNLSHTEGMAIFGFCRGRRIGVDIEHLRTDFRTAEIAERFFSVSERAALREIPAARSHEFFFRLWTRKEAYIKALGEGLSHPLSQFDVSLDEIARLLATRPDAAEAQRWRLQNLPIAPDFVAAMALEIDGARVPAR